MTSEQTLKIYGAAPIDLGLIDISPKEMMFWLYLPVKLPDSTELSLPDNVKMFEPIVIKALEHVVHNDGQDFLDKSYVYLSAKVMHISPTAPGNRPGWHSDGFLSDDLNFVWSDSSPTFYWEPASCVSFTKDHLKSLDEMTELANRGPIVTYPDKHLCRLDQTVIHRVGDVSKPMVRAFAKVSVSKNKYDLVGNSINHELAPDWTYHERNEIRNHPAKAGGDTSGNK